MKTKIEQLSGVSLDLFRGSSPAFFTPFTSKSQIFYSTAAIVSAPLIFTMGTAFFALKALFSLYEAITNISSFNFNASTQDFKAAKADFLLAAKTCVLIVLSPFVNAANCIGSAINSPQQQTEESINDALASP